MASLEHEMTVQVKVNTEDIETSEAFKELVRHLVREELEKVTQQLRTHVGTAHHA